MTILIVIDGRDAVGKIQDEDGKKKRKKKLDTLSMSRRVKNDKRMDSDV